MLMSTPGQLEILNVSIESRRQEENQLRVGFRDALEIITDVTFVNAIVSASRSDLVMTKPVPQRQIETYPFDHRRAGNFIPRLGGFGGLRYRPRRPGDELEKTVVGRYPVTEIGFATYIQLLARGSRGEYPAFAEEHGIDPEVALDAFDNSLARYGAFARMTLVAPDLTKSIVRSCVDMPEQRQPRDLEIYVAYSLASLLVDSNDLGVKGPSDNEVLSR